MKQPSVYLKMRVLGAVDTVAGRTRHERIHQVAAMTFLGHNYDHNSEGNIKAHIGNSCQSQTRCDLMEMASQNLIARLVWPANGAPWRELPRRHSGGGWGW